ncbi:Ubiquinol oxidase subunit 2 [Parachlamydia acanthamoebae]|nr:Ubiquinol oxidase subunit 2 [Parachlamydia acanthamoebae]
MSNMTPGKRFVPFLLVFSSIILFLFLIMQPLTILQYRDSIAVLFPKGIIALEERNLLLIIQAIMLLVIIPVYVLTFIFSWKYRANNLKAKYDPDFDDNRLAEYLWWGIPLFFTLIIGVLTWVKTYELDPLRPLESDKKPITIQVVALQWKWLFIYPEEKIASLNFLQIPEQIPIHFEITADAPMNSFWIPHLGGQIYAMPKMKTQLHLIANATGDFRGSSANISGEGFAGMHFITRASSEEDYHKWVESVKQSSNVLNLDEYNKLAAPSSNVPPEIYQLKDDNLFEQVLMKYMHPKGD